MLISEIWLREWVQPKLTTSALSEKLTLAGLEVEGIESATSLNLSKANSGKLLVGRIVETAPHPDADRLQVCLVDVGKRNALTIVCGAANARVDLVVPVALVGCQLPGVEIKQSEIRGVLSSGMLCSTAELGLTEQASGLMELGAAAKPGMLIADYLQLDDAIIEVDLTPNRGDCLCLQGIAREVSALTGARMKDIAVKPVKAQIKDVIAVTLKAPEACPRFVGRVIKGIDMQAATPDWMQEKLRRSGLRSINPVVDITNFVMLESGQPMHAYDLKKLSGGIVVRMAKAGEKLKLLDGSSVKLTADNLVIADRKKAVGLAGIMGGDETAISDTTVDIFFEAAFFAPTPIAGKARGFGMHTDASHRFERGVNPHGQVAAIERATALLIEIAGGKPGKVCHAVERKALPKFKKINLDRSEILRVLGIAVPSKDVSMILRRLGMTAESTKTGWKVTPPNWRFDLTGQHDLVEEVGRCYGYEHIAPRLPTATASGSMRSETLVALDRVKQVLVERGYFEAISYSFVDSELQASLVQAGKGIRLMNPIADNMAEMRRSLWPGLLTAMMRNLNRQAGRVRLFEQGNVFHLKGRKRVEINRIAGMIAGSVAPQQWGANDRAPDFFDIKSDVEALLALSRDGRAGKITFEAAEHPALHPGQCARIVRGKEVIGYVGQLHPSTAKELDIDETIFMFELDVAAISVAGLPQFAALSKFPAVQRDLAVVVDRAVSAGEIAQTIRVSAGKLLKQLELFDIYTGESIENTQKSFAFSLTFQAESSNLKATEIESVTNRIMGALEKSHGAALRI